jgi:hypothetical protein
MGVYPADQFIESLLAFSLIKEVTLIAVPAGNIYSDRRLSTGLANAALMD